MLPFAMRLFLALPAACAAAAFAAGDPQLSVTVRGSYALADTTSETSVSAKGADGADLSSLRYCICDMSSNVVCRYRDHVAAKPTRLKVNLPAGRYIVRTTDGTNFWGAAPYVVLRRENPRLGTVADVREPEQPSAPSGLARLLHDVGTLGEDRLSANRPKLLPRRLGVRYAALGETLPPETLAER